VPNSPLDKPKFALTSGKRGTQLIISTAKKKKRRPTYFFSSETLKPNLEEGLRRDDLKHSVDRLFTIDQFQSKMGDDKNIITLRFRASNKEPAIDLMEFIERGYEFVLDADVSSGEEKDGKYSVFVELERNEEAPSNIKDLLRGLSQLCDISDWRFRWYKDSGGHDFDEQAIKDFVPLSPEEYNKLFKILFKWVFKYSIKYHLSSFWIQFIDMNNYILNILI
jgi:hypothetical protein